MKVVDIIREISKLNPTEKQRIVHCDEKNVIRFGRFQEFN